MFKAPKLSVKSKLLDKDKWKDLPTFEWEDLSNKDEIAQGAFGSVFTAEWKNKQRVVKKLLGADNVIKNKFLKEARLLKNFDHKNIVKFHGICFTPLAIMLEYIYFDFAPFFDGEVDSPLNNRASSLEEFLRCLHDFDAVDVVPVQTKIVVDITSGLKYLHDHKCFHRDLKTANILVSNQHYSSLKHEDEFALEYSKEPIVCKLTDFGESRGSDIQTQSIANSCTNNLLRGTVAYMAPEVLDFGLSEARSRDLEKIDIWALGMVIYCIMNADVPYPYKYEIENVRKRSKKANSFDIMKEILARHKRPRMSEQYKCQQATKWTHLVKAYKECTSFLPARRPTLNHVLEVVNDCKPYYTIPLSVHQGTVSQ